MLNYDAVISTRSQLGLTFSHTVIACFYPTLPYVSSSKFSLQTQRIESSKLIVSSEHQASPDISIHHPDFDSIDLPLLGDFDMRNSDRFCIVLIFW